MSELKFNPRELTALVVDDHDPMRKAMRKVLNGMEFAEVIEAFDGTDAIEVLGETPIDLIICDIYMRKKSGLDVLSYLRNRGFASDIPVIIVTGEAGKSDIVKAADLGTDDYLLKPFHTDDLEIKVVKTLNKFHSPTPLLKKLRTADRHIMNRDYAAALESFDEALEVDPKSMRARHSKALALNFLQRTDEAIELLKESVAINRDYHKVYALLADIHVSHNDFPTAMRFLEQELQINAKQPERHVLMAKLAMRLDDIVKAVHHFREALKENSKHVVALLGMGRALALDGNIEKSVYYFKRVRRYHPQETKALESMVSYCLKANQARRAEIALRDEKRDHPRRFDTYLVLARLYANTEREDEAIKVLQELLDLDPQNVIAMRMLGGLYFMKGHFNEAAAIYNRLSRAQPNFEAFMRLGQSLLEAKRHGDAISRLMRALRYEPRNPMVFFFLARAHAETRQVTKALLLYRRSIDLGCTHVDAKKGLAGCKAALEARHKKTAPLQSA